MGRIIGIDLGTTTTEASIIEDGKPVMIQNSSGNIIVPSAVGLDADGNWVVGERARAQYLLSPENTAIEIKRLMGSSEKIRLGSQSYSAVELSAKLLEFVRTYASRYLNEEIDRAVISVPAYFDDIKRQQTLKAGQMAGFQVERILNEPTAASMSYGIEHLDEESHILVYDLGGGTFDVTLLEMFDGVLEAKASSGDNELGGKDFDEAIVKYLSDQFMAKHGINLMKDAFARNKLKEAAENGKKELSTEEKITISIPMIAKKDSLPLALEEEIDRELFLKLTGHLLERTHGPIETVLSDAGIEKHDIDRIILVGGSTRMPLVSEDIEAFLNKKPERAVNPDFAVAEGAAIQAGLIEGSISREDSIMMTDVNPYTLGIRAGDGFSFDNMSVIIPRNITIPAKRSEIYTTSHDYQREARIEVYQGESSFASHNHFLGEFMVEGIPSKRRGKEKIQVDFSYDLNGMLDVKATICSTGQDASVVINMMEETEDPNARLEKWKDSPHEKKFRSVIRRAEKRLKKAEEEGDYLSQASLFSLLKELKEAIIEDDIEAGEEIEQDLIDLLREL
ncbi:MAG: Hsp70 family protein [Lachnospiraceae bacterium]|nr:Hsp70 family protein [Lachnospiraceae bacterium]